MEISTVISQIKNEIKSYEEEINFYTKKIEFLEDMYDDLTYRLSVAGYEVDDYLFEDNEGDFNEDYDDNDETDTV